MVVDKRDLRDPQALGERILNMHDVGVPSIEGVSDNWESLCNLHAPNYSPEPVDHSADYRAELEARAAEGDRYAESMLKTGQPLE